MMKKLMALILSITMLFSVALAMSPSDFNDVRGHWAEDDIRIMADNEIVSGYPDGNFLPENTITRAEFTTQIWRLAGSPVVKESSGAFFIDIADGEWYSTAIDWAAENKIVTGILQADGTHYFNPNANITREDMAVIIVRYLATTDYRYPYAANGGLSTMADRSEVAEYAYNAVFNLTRRSDGIITGYERVLPDEYTDDDYARYVFRPQNNTTRAEATTVIARVFRAVEEIGSGWQYQ